MIPYGHLGFALHMTYAIGLMAWIGLVVDKDDDDDTTIAALVVLGLNAEGYLFKLAVAIYTTTQCHGTYKLLAIRQLLLLFFYAPFGLLLVVGKIKVAILLVCLLCAFFRLEIETLTKTDRD